MWPFKRKQDDDRSELERIKDVVAPLTNKGIMGSIPDAVMMEVFAPGRFASERQDVWIATDSTIASGVTFKGPCAIGKGTTIAADCKIGPDVFIQISEIGRNCQIRDSYLVQSKLDNNVVVSGSNIISSVVMEGNRITKMRLKETVIPEGRFK